MVMPRIKKKTVAPKQAEESPKKTVNVFDYLSERRKARDNWMSTGNLSLDRLEWEKYVDEGSPNVKERLGKLEEETKRFDKRIKSFERFTIGRTRSLGDNEMIDNAYLDSIHAKICLLYTSDAADE